MSANKVSTELLGFLTKLEKNNDRDWFSEHKDEYIKVEAEAKNIYKTVFELIKQHDDVDTYKMFRIYRDVRFSKNKLPYKIHFGGSFHRTKPHLRGGYYLHLQPNDASFITCGFWEPSKDDLFRIRKEFELDSTEISRIISQKTFKNTWGDFVGEELKTAPKGFDKEHQNINLIRKKQFMFTKRYSDKEVIKDGFIEDVNKSFIAIRPYFNFMSDVLTTNLNGELLI